MTTTITLGRYTVRQGIRVDNPAFPSYLIYCGERLIGKQFSMPSESDCAWLDQSKGTYAKESRWPETSEGRQIWNTAKRRKGRPTDVEREKRDAYLALQPDEAPVE
jgi:hypothetical protein